MKKIILLSTLFIVTIVNVVAQNYSHIAMINSYTYEELKEEGDDDEIAAAEWLLEQGGKYIGLEELKDGSFDLEVYKVIWIHLDREIPANKTEFMTTDLQPFLEEDVLQILTDYYKNGGNFLLTTHGAIYLKELGRVDIAPDVVDFGFGSANPDVWYLSPTHATASGMKVYDRSDDNIYKDMTCELITRGNGAEYMIFPLIGAGVKEDHNCFWTMDIPGNVITNENESKLTTFQETYNVEVLGTWSHVEDYFGAAIARWNPTEEYQGKAITIGIAAYEWNQNSGTNSYQENIIQMTRNALKELYGKDDNGNGITPDIYNNINVMVNGSCLQIASDVPVKSISIYSVTGTLCSHYLINKSDFSTNLIGLTDGTYILKVEKENGEIITRKFLK